MKIEYDKTSPVGVTHLVHMGGIDDVLSDSGKLKTAAIAGVAGYLASRLLGVGPPKLVGLALLGYFLVK